MAKKAGTRARKQDTNPWTEDRREDSLDGMFGNMCAAANTHLGRDDIVVGTDADQLVVGLPFPALCLRYLHQSDVFPLSRVWQLAGEEGSCKSAMLYEIMRWHMIYGGGGCLAETENKDAPMLRHSILEYNAHWISRCAYAGCDTVEQWQDYLTVNINNFRAMLDLAGGPGRTVPVCFGIDSLTAVDSQKEIDKTMKEGHASRGYATIAMLISRYMRQGVAKNLRGFPFSLVGTNHLKPSTDERGLPKDHVPGGKAVPFMATFMYAMKRLADIDLSEYGGVRVNIKLAKNSVGVSRKAIQADMLWWQELAPDGRTTRQRHVWDWHTATIDMFAAFEVTEGKKTLFKELMKICDLRLQRKTKTVWSRTLGIPESAPVPYRVAGQLLETRLDLLLPMYPLLGINAHTKFQPGLDYRQMELQAQAKEAQQGATLYETHAGPEMPQLDQVALEAQAAQAQAATDADDAVSDIAEMTEGELPES